jgi:hypothetical protein
MMLNQTSGIWAQKQGNKRFGHNRMGTCHEGSQGQTETATVLRERSSTGNVDIVHEIRPLALETLKLRDILV